MDYKPYLMLDAAISKSITWRAYLHIRQAIAFRINMTFWFSANNLWSNYANQNQYYVTVMTALYIIFEYHGIESLCQVVPYKVDY